MSEESKEPTLRILVMRGTTTLETMSTEELTPAVVENMFLNIQEHTEHILGWELKFIREFREAHNGLSPSEYMKATKNEG